MPTSSVSIILPSDISPCTFISSKFIEIYTDSLHSLSVCLNITSTVSPTDLPLSCKNRYSISNVAKSPNIR